MEGCVLHGLAYGVALRLILTQAVRGERRGRSWFVDPDSLGRWKAGREDAKTGAQQATATA